MGDCVCVCARLCVCVCVGDLSVSVRFVLVGCDCLYCVLGMGCVLQRKNGILHGQPTRRVQVTYHQSLQLPRLKQDTGCVVISQCRSADSCE